MSRNCTQRRLDLRIYLDCGTSVACTPARNHPTPNNESLDLLVLSTGDRDLAAVANDAI